MRRDLAAISGRQLAMILKDHLDRNGYDCHVYRKIKANNEAAPLQQEYYYGAFPDFTCKVILGQPFQGLSIANFISVSEKIDTKFNLMTNVELEQDAKLVIETPSGETNIMRVLEHWANFSLSKMKIAYKYVAVEGTEEFSDNPASPITPPPLDGPT